MSATTHWEENYYKKVADDCVKQGQYERAVGALLQAIHITDHDASLYNQLGSAYHLLKDYQKAKSAFQKAIDLDGEYVEAITNLGFIYAAMEDYTAALGEYHRALSIQSNYPVANNNIGVVYYKLGAHDMAVQHFKKAISANKEYYEARCNLAFLLLECRYYREAREAFAHLLEHFPPSANFYNAISVACAKLGEYEKAVRHLQQALCIQPDHREANENLLSITKALRDKAIDLPERLGYH